jgi:hypothetical protein
MHYVVLRDDDTNALTPVDYLERLYRPFLERGLPVNLAAIPNVRTDITYGENIPEGFLVAKNGVTRKMAPIGENQKLVAYLRANAGFRVVQHGYNHEFVNGDCEFEHDDRADIVRRIECGREMLRAAGLGEPRTFVAPYDRFTRMSMAEVAARFRLISTGWFEWKRVPVRWWPLLGAKKISRTPHWHVNGTVLLSHPGSFLSYHKPIETMLDAIRTSIASRRLTVLVTHWWEFFRDKVPDERLIAVLHETAAYLASASQISVVAFADIEKGKVPLN